MRRNRQRADVLIDQAKELHKAITPIPPAWEAVFDDTCMRLDALADWNEEEGSTLADVLIDRLNMVGYDDKYPKYNEAQSAFFIRWLEAFAKLLALVRHTLRLPILREMKACSSQSWFKKWLRDIEWQGVWIPDGLTSETMETVVTATLANQWGPDFSNNYGDGIAKYCGTCRLFYPVRRKSAGVPRGQYIDAPFLTNVPSEVLALCPHCGTPPIRDGQDALLWASVLY